MAFVLPAQLTAPEVFLVFIVFIFLISRAAKVIFRLIFISAIGFAFPWIAQYLGVGIGFAPTIENGILFAAAGGGLFFVYEFLHFITAATKIITWVPRKILSMTEENEMQKMKEEVAEIERQKKQQ